MKTQTRARNKVMSTEQKRDIARKLHMTPIQKLTLNLTGGCIISDLIIMDKKFTIYLSRRGYLFLYRSYTGEMYGTITVSHAKRLINNSNK